MGDGRGLTSAHSLERVDAMEVLVHSSRRAVLDEVADVVTEILGIEIVRVGIDGIDGSGKTRFADELADVLRERGRSVIRASVDGFHNPRDIRYRMGRHSPEGYYRDSFDYDRLREVLLDPLSPGGSRRYVAAIHDVATDQPVEMEERIATAGSVFVVDGIFLHRPELADYWDCSVFLDVERDVANERMARRDGTAAESSAGLNPRYVEGQRIYLETCHPSRVATIVIDNNDLARPVTTPNRPASASSTTSPGGPPHPSPDTQVVVSSTDNASG